MNTNLKKIFAVLTAAVLFLAFFDSATALDKGSLIEKVQEAFEKQVSLSEKPRSMEDINAIMNTHFTESFKDKFYIENIIETEEGFQTFGSDFAPYYIPNFKYGENMKAIQKGNSIYLYEYLKYEEGPVNFEDGYQAVKLTKTDGTWKVDDIYYALPEELAGLMDGNESEPLQEETNPETVSGEEAVNSPLNLKYMNKIYFLFQGFFMDKDLDLFTLTV